MYPKRKSWYQVIISVLSFVQGSFLNRIFSSLYNLPALLAALNPKFDFFTKQVLLLISWDINHWNQTILSTPRSTASK